MALQLVEQYHLAALVPMTTLTGCFRAKGSVSNIQREVQSLKCGLAFQRYNIINNNYHDCSTAKGNPVDNIGTF